MNSRRLARARAVVLLGFAASCENDPSGPGNPSAPQVASVTIATPVTKLPIGASSQFSAVLRDSGGNILIGRKIAWSSSNGAVATVSAYGLVFAHGVGNTDITAVSERQAGHLSATVTDPAINFGSITGAVRNAASEALGDTARLRIRAVAAFGWNEEAFIEYDRPASYRISNLPSGRWTLTLSAMHAWSFVFPGLKVYADTTVTVDVVSGETTVVPAIVMRPRAPLLLVGLETCPWALPDPPTLSDWWECDSGYWGGAAADIVVSGVAGTNTESISRKGMIGPAAYERPASFWQETPWSTYFDMEVLGEYDVTIVLVSDASRPSWRLVPWQTSTVRVKVGQGLSYTEFNFWAK